MMGGGQMAGGQMGFGAAGGPSAGGAGGQTAGQGPKITAAPGNRRNDPFAPWWPAPPPPPAVETIEPVRIATLQSWRPPDDEPVHITEVPDRRVSGILTGNGVYALIDSGSEQYVVKPGDPVGDYRVDKIGADSVTLKRTVGNRTYTQVVPLSDAGGAPRMGGGPSMPGGGMMPGGMGTGGMRRGMMPGGMGPGGGGPNGLLGGPGVDKGD